MDDIKLKTILKNLIEKCDGIHFYRLEVNGNTARVYKSGTRYLIELDNTGEVIDIDKDINDVEYGFDEFYAEFETPFGSYGVNIARDMSPQEIEAELA